MFHGFDFDVTMLRIASMNLMLHGVDRPDIHYMDTLSNKFMDDDKLRRFASDALTLALANPPFKGSLDESDVHRSLTGKVKTRKTELLFLVLLLRMLKLGGRCGVIVPDGVLFGSSKAHVELRKMLVEENQIDAVVKLPAGVFKPYAGVSTAILLFTKGGRTEHVWFYDVQADGFSLDDKRDPTPDQNDLPDVRVRWAARNPRKDTDRTARAFFVAKADIVEQNYDLAIGRYKEVIHEEKQTDPPKVILERLKTLETEIVTDVDRIEGDGVFVQAPMARLGDHTLLISSGSTPRGGESVYLQDGAVMLIRSQNVRMNRLDLSDVAYISEEINSEMRRSVVQRGDVLLNITGASIGRVALFSLKDVRANVNQHVCIIRPKAQELDGRFLAYFISSPRFQAEIDRLQRGGTRQALTFSQIADFPIPLPPLAEQERIATILDKVAAIREKHEKAMREIELLHAAHSQLAFRWGR
jgi:hypothetical protein